MKYVKCIVIIIYEDHRDSRRISIEKPKNEKKKRDTMESKGKEKKKITSNHGMFEKSGDTS